LIAVAQAYVSIGSNVDRKKNIRSAIRELHEKFGPLVISSVYDSAPVGFDGERFFNLVVGFETRLKPEELVQVFHAIEQQHGRGRDHERFASRTLDLDLLLYDNLVRHDGTMDLPHGEILDYAFVLRPLEEIAPDVIHPELKKPFAELWQEREPRLAPVTRSDFVVNE